MRWSLSKALSPRNVTLLLEVQMTLRTAVSIAALTIALGFLPEAMAQTTPAERAPKAEAPKTPVTGQIVVQDANTILVKDLIGQTVYAPDKTKIGSISDLLLSKDGKTVEGFVIGVGGFLGIGEKSVAMKIDRLKMTAGPNGSFELAMDAKKEELTNTPTFKSKRELDAEKQAEQRRSEAPGQRPTGQKP
jgi:sporulation protein YlmC with PRC-barrel domain